MPEYRRRRATKRSAATPIGPKGCGGMAPPSSLSLLGDGGHRRRRGAWNPGPWRAQRTTLGAPAGPRRARSAYLLYVEHPEARKHSWVRCIADRSRKLVRYAGWVYGALLERPHNAAVLGLVRVGSYRLSNCDANLTHALGASQQAGFCLIRGRDQPRGGSERNAEIGVLHQCRSLGEEKILDTK